MVRRPGCELHEYKEAVVSRASLNCEKSREEVQLCKVPVEPRIP